jgi:hypothetical protein
MDNVEFLILSNLLYNEQYLRKVIPFIKSEYFEDTNQRIVFEEILKFVQEYNQPATKEVLCIEVEKRQDINDTSFKEITHLVGCLMMFLLSLTGWLILLKSGVVIGQSILHLWNQSILQMVKMRRKIVIVFLVFYQMLFQYLLIHTLDTIIC